MPLPALAIAAYSAISASSAAPVIGAAVVALGIVATHHPGQLDEVNLAGQPERAAECMQHNVASLKTTLVAAVTPLYGTGTMGVILKRRGDPLMSVVIQEAGAGSHAEFRPLTPPEEQPDVIRQMIAGC